VEAGVKGWNLLTGLLFQSVEELGEKIAAYREARLKAGHHPGAGHVTLMLHTFLGDNEERVKETVREPFIEYLRSSVDLWQHGSENLANLKAQQQTEVLNFAFERYYRSNGLFGTPESCLRMVQKLSQIGVDEIACLIDFGIEPGVVLDGLRWLGLLQEKAGGPRVPSGRCHDSARNGLAGIAPEASGGCTAVGGRHSRSDQPAWDNLSPALDGNGSSDHHALLTWIKGTITSAISLATHRSPEALAPNTHFLNLGIDSLKAVEFMNTVQERLGLRLSHELLFEFPTVERMAEILVSRYRVQLQAKILSEQEHA